MRTAEFAGPLCLATVLAAAATAKEAAPSLRQALSPNRVISVENGTLTSDNRPVRAGFFIPYQATLRLSSGGRAVFRYGDAGALLLQGPAVLRLVRGRRPGAVLLEGSLLSVFPSSKTKFFVVTRGLLVAKTDADFFLEVAGRNAIYLCVCRGAVEVADTKTKRFNIRVAAATGHKAGTFRLTSSTILQTDAAVEHHGEDDLMKLRLLMDLQPKK